MTIASPAQTEQSTRPGIFITHWFIPALAGIGLGLSLARLLYEYNPLTFRSFGGWIPSLVLAVLGLGISLIARRRFRRYQSLHLIPTSLVWLYIFTSPYQVDPLRGLLLIGGSVLLSGLFLMGDIPKKIVPTWSDVVLLAVITLTAYLLTLQRTIGRADTFEFQVTAPVLGIAHPTGYPLYILLGKMFSWLPVGRIATRINLLSAVAAVTAICLLYVVMQRILMIERLAAVIAVLAFGLAPVMWSQAVVAEVYGLHNAFVITLLGGALLLHVETNIPHQKIVIALFALTGLALTHHLTTVLIIPSLAAAILLAWPRLTWKQWLIAIGLFAAGLLIYLYIPIRWPALHDGQLMPFGDFLGWITGSRFSGALQLRAWIDDPGRYGIIGRLLLNQYGWPGVVLGSIGLIALIKDHWRVALISAGIFAAQGFYGLNYLVPDIDVFLIPMFLVLALWMGYGIHTLITFLSEALKRVNADSQPALIFASLITITALLPLSLAWTVGPQFDWSDEAKLEVWGRYVLSLPLDEGSVILADSEKIAPLEYLHRIEGLRPDMEMVVLGTEADYQAYLFAALEEGRTVYLQRYLPGLEGAFYLRSVGPLVEVGTEPFGDTVSVMPQSPMWENGITLLNYDLSQQEVSEGEMSHLMLYWSADALLIENFQMHVRLRSEESIIWEAPPAYPVSNRYPPVAWKSERAIPDYYLIDIPVWVRPDTYILEVSLSRPFSTEFIPLADGGQWVTITSLDVHAADSYARSGQRMAVTTRDDGLLSLDYPTQLAANHQTSLVASLARHPVQITVEGSGKYPIGDGLVLTLDERESGQVDLRLDAGGPIICGWLVIRADGCLLGTASLIDLPEQAIANFENKILLTGVDFEAGRLQPGQTIDVTLHWQVLNAMSEDYTIFVHLLGPDGRVHGQIDQWPVQGTYPTSQWPTGDSILDRYTVPLNADAPPGSYRLEIGVYLLSTNTRLPIFNDVGDPIDDKILLDGLIVTMP